MRGASRSRAGAREAKSPKSVAERPSATPAVPGPANLEALHGTLGNLAVGRLLDHGGRPLEPQTRAAMEGRFGQDLGGVRVHTDDQAAASARAVAARAYTVGEHILFGQGGYAPGSAAGRLLLAHELAHVIQQRRGGPPPSGSLQHALEAGAWNAAGSAVSGGRISVTGASGPGVARAPSGGRGTAEEGAAYRRLRDLEDQADLRSEELQQQASDYLDKKTAAAAAAKAAKEPTADAKKKAGAEPAAAGKEKPPREPGSNITMGVGYAVDEKGQLRTLVSGSGGRRRGVTLKPGEEWVGAAGAQSADDKHAEANIIRKVQNPTRNWSSKKPQPQTPWNLVTLGAGRYHCDKCTPSTVTAGGTTASMRKESASADFVFGPALQALQKAQAAPTPKAPEVIYRRPPGGGGAPSGGPGSPPPTGGGGGGSPGGSGGASSATAGAHPAPAAGVSHTAAGEATSHVAPAAGSAHATAVPGSARPAPVPGANQAATTATAAHPGPATAAMHPASAAGTVATVPATSSTGPAPGRTARAAAPVAGGTQRAAAVLDRPASATATGRPSISPTPKASSLEGPARLRPQDLEVGRPEERPPAPTTERIGPGVFRRGPAAAPATLPPGTGTEGTITPPPSVAPHSTPPSTTVPEAQAAGTHLTTPSGVAKPQAATGTTPPAPAPGAAAPATPRRPPAGGGAQPAAGTQANLPPPQTGGVQPAPVSRVGTASPAIATGGAIAPVAVTRPPRPAPVSAQPAAITASEHPAVVTRAAGPAPAPASGPSAAGGPPAAASRVDTPTVKSTKVGWGGVTRTSKTEESAGDVVASSTKQTSLTRDKGRLGVGSTSTRRFGQEDEKGNLVKGSEFGTERKAGLVAGPGGVGGFGSLGATGTQAHGGGVKTTQSVGVDGQMTVNAIPVPGKTPPQYQVVVVISLGGHLAGGAGVERGRVGASGSVSLEASITGTFTHTFSAEETDRYLGALKDPNAGGAGKEFRVLQLAAHGRVDEARALLATVQQGSLSPDAIKRMREGDVTDVTTHAGGAIGAGVQAQGATFGAGLSGSLSRSGSLRRQVVIKDGRALVTVEVLSSKGYQAAGSVSAFSVEVGAGHGKLESTGESVTFQLDPQSEADARMLERIGQVDSAEELRTLAGSSGSVTSRTESHATTTQNTASVGFAGLQIAGSGEHTYGERTTTDRSGVTREYTGASGSGFTAGAKDGPKAGFHQTDTVSLAAGPGNQGLGDVSTETSQTNLGRSVQALKESAEKKPVGTALGLATGGTPAIQQTTEVVGMKLSDAEFSALSGAAQDNHAWTKAFYDSRSIGNQSFLNAQALRRRVAAAGGNRDAIAQAFAEYAKDNDNAAQFVQQIVRPAGQLQGGIRYDWPQELSDQRAQFDALVVGDPIGAAETLATTSDAGVKQAVDQLKGAKTQLAAMSQKIRENRSKFSDEAAVVEMLRRIGTRRSELQKEIELLEPAIPGGPPKTTPSAASGDAATPTAAADDAKAQEQAKAREAEHRQELASQIASKERDFDGEKAKERQTFAEIDAEYSHWYRNADVIEVIQKLTYLKDRVYVQWDASVAELKKLMQEAGVDPNLAAAYGPDRAGWQARYNNPDLHKY